MMRHNNYDAMNIIHYSGITIFISLVFFFQDLMFVNDYDILSYMLESLKMMCLHGDILNFAFREHQEFFIWCQENVFIRT